MKKFLLILLLISVSVQGQKAKFNTHKFTLEFEKPSLFNEVKTFSYEIQDDGVYWNHNPENDSTKPQNYTDYPTLQSMAQPLNLIGLNQVDVNGDLQIVVGFLGKQPYNDAGALVLEGKINVLVLDHKKRLLFEKVEKIKKKITSNLQDYPTNSIFNVNKSKVQIVTSQVQKILDEISVVFTGKKEFNLPFGYFTNTKKGLAEDFNIKSKVLINDILNEKSKENLTKAKKYFNSQIDIDFGKKMKENRKFKAIYSNLASISILLGEDKEAREYAKIAKDNSGLFDAFYLEYEKYFKTNSLVEDIKEPTLDNFFVGASNVYNWVFINKGKMIAGKKESVFDQIHLERLVYRAPSGMVSLDKGLMPKARLFENKKARFVYNCSDRNSIIFNNGDSITFKLEKGIYVPIIKKGSEEKN